MALRILLVNSFFKPNEVGGAENSVRILAKALVRTGSEVAVFTGDAPEANSAPHLEYVDGVSVSRARSPLFGLDVFSGRASLRTRVLGKIPGEYNRSVTQVFHRTVEKFRPDVVHTNNLYGVSTGVWSVARESGVPCVHTIRDYFLLDPTGVEGRCPRPISAVRTRALGIRARRDLSAVTSPSQYLLDRHTPSGCLEGLPRHVIPNALAALPAPSRIESGRPHTPFRFLYVGKLDTHKGVKTLLAALEEAPADDLALTICGEGPLEAAVKCAAQRDRRIRYLGQIPSDELSGEYRDADALIVPSEWGEPFGRVVIEGLAYGLPVVAAKVGGIPEILEATGAGLLFGVGQSAGLGESMRAVRDPLTYDTMCMAARKAAAAYSDTNQVQAFLGVYEQCLK